MVSGKRRAAKPVRTVHSLTRRFGSHAGDFSTSVRTGLVSETARVTPGAATGFLIGAGSELDYRAAALVHHSPGPGGGIIAAVESTGRAVFRDVAAAGMPLLAVVNRGETPIRPGRGSSNGDTPIAG